MLASDGRKTACCNAEQLCRRTMSGSVCSALLDIGVSRENLPTSTQKLLYFFTDCVGLILSAMFPCPSSPPSLPTTCLQRGISLDMLLVRPPGPFLHNFVKSTAPLPGQPQHERSYPNFTITTLLGSTLWPAWRSELDSWPVACAVPGFFSKCWHALARGHHCPYDSTEMLRALLSRQSLKSGKQRRRLISRDTGIVLLLARCP